MTGTAEEEWIFIVNVTPASCREVVAELARRHGASLAAHFYDTLMAHEEATSFLGHDIVHQRLQASMERWLCDVLAYPQPDPAAVVAHQRHVGEVHARIQLPIHLVARGARLIKHALFKHVQDAFSEDFPLQRQALAYAGQLIDLALELMTEAFIRNTQRGARTDEAYRLFSLGQNISVERERQRSVLLEWGQEILFSLHRRPMPVALPRLTTSEFGLWFNHKAASMFDGDPELDQIRDIIERVDSTLLPRLSAPDSFANHGASMVLELQNELDNLKFQLGTLFAHHLEIENGRDALTRLLNRRFLPAVMAREIQLAKKHKHQFAVVMIDIDHFKRVNDEYGHDAGDLVLQQAATLLMNGVRNGDFVFRYGGEELLLILVELAPSVALRIAESLRQRFADTEFLIGQGRSLHVTISVGVALYDGHPDHQYLVQLADKAMYEAKQNGRNQVCSSLA
jgi:diguanylate cyclase